MKVLFFCPGFPAEIPYFVRALARQGAQVIGVGDQPQAALPGVAKEALVHYVQVPNMWDESGILKNMLHLQQKTPFDRLVCLWEPGMSLAGRLREKFGISGMNEAETLVFRDKEVMKQTLVERGIRLPQFFRTSSESAVKKAAEEIGFPLVIKPIAGAGSADTYKVTSAEHLESILPKIKHVQEVMVEEFVTGNEYTYDTVCANGRVLYENVAIYRPNPIIGRSEEWISPQTVTLRDMSPDHIQKGIALGRQVLKALNFRTGFTHMEWFYNDKGEAVFGEIAARPPGGRSVELMNYGCDFDVFEAWAEALLKGKISQKIQRKYNAAVIFKRAQGQGRIQRVQGLEKIRRELGQHIVCENLLPIGAMRRNWKQTLVSDGYIILRHPDLKMTFAMADQVGRDLQMFAG